MDRKKNVKNIQRAILIVTPVQNNFPFPRGNHYSDYYYYFFVVNFYLYACILVQYSAVLPIFEIYINGMLLYLFFCSTLNL